MKSKKLQKIKSNKVVSYRALHRNKGGNRIEEIRKKDREYQIHHKLEHLKK